MSNKDEKENEKLSEAPIWMWGVGLCGLALVAGSIAFMFYEGWAGDRSPPDVSFEVTAIRPGHNGFLVEFRVLNTGGSTAEGLTVEGELRRGAERVEVSGTTIQYVPSHSVRTGGLYFSADPREYELTLTAEGYETP